MWGQKSEWQLSWAHWRTDWKGDEGDVDVDVDVENPYQRGGCSPAGKMQSSNLLPISWSAVSPGGNVPDTEAGDPYKRPHS